MSDKQLKSNMSSVPIWKKMNLTVEEASEYSGIGTSKIKDYRIAKIVLSFFGTGQSD